jgi:hypothetical protein
MLRTIATTEKIEVTEYPYGRLRTSAFFSLDFDKKKGFRSVFQTIDPKSGRLNKPKKGTYSAIEMMYYEDDTNHVKHVCFDMNGCEAINKACKFISEHFDKFTTEQIEYIYMHLFTMLKISMKAKVIYCGSKFEELKPLFDVYVQLALQGIKTKENLFAQINLDIEALKATEKPDFNPFIVKTVTNE